MTWKLYQYTPSKAGAVVACILFVLVTTYLTFQFSMALRRLKSPVSKKQVYTVIPFLVGGLFEVIGYATRVRSLENPERLGSYIISSFMLLVAPALFAASIYMALGRIITNLEAGHHSIIPLKWLTKVFVIGDVCSFLIQGGGGGLQALALAANIGKALIIVGLIIQILFFAFFIIVMGIFQTRIYREPTSLSLSTRYIPSNLRNWQMVINTLFACSLLIFIRSVVRVIEYCQGYTGYIISHEIFLYMLDGLLMLIQMIIFSAEDVSGFFAQSDARLPISVIVETSNFNESYKV